MPPYVVQQGDTLESIALAKRLEGWEKIYDHPDNRWFKDRCEASPPQRNPHILYPGECFEVPSKVLAEARRPIDQTNQFVVPKPLTTKLKLVLEIDGLEDFEWELTAPLGGKLTPHTGKAGPDGLIEAEVDVGAQNATLKVGARTWNLKIAHLNPLDAQVRDQGVSGVQGRLLNLGYAPGPIDGILGELTRAAIRAFQRDHPPLAVDGICGPQTSRKLTERHGC